MSGTDFKLKLSIIIPTYNGVLWLEDAVRSVVSQLQDTNQVELIVRDNASTDGSEALIMRLQDEFPGIIKYDKRELHTEELNVNFKEAVALSVGEYFVLMGNDDLLMPTYVSYILSLIDKYPEVGLFYMNRIGTDINYKKGTLFRSEALPEMSKIYSDFDSFLKEHVQGPDFITVNVLRRDCYERGLKFEKPYYYGYEFYSVMLFGLKDQKAHIMYLFPPFVLQRHPISRSWSKKSALYIIVGLSNIFKDLDPNDLGVYSAWKQHLKDCGRIYWYLASITQNKDLYKNKFEELAEHLNKSQRFYVRMLLKYSFFKYTYIGCLKFYLKIIK